MDIDELVNRINNHYGEVWAMAYRPANTYKDGEPINTALELHIGRDLTLLLDDTSESSWSVGKSLREIKNFERDNPGWTISHIGTKLAINIGRK